MPGDAISRLVQYGGTRERYRATSFYMLNDATVTQDLAAAMWNNTAGLVVGVLSLKIWLQNFAASTGSSWLSVYRTSTAPTGGTAITVAKSRSSMPASQLTSIVSRAPSDNGALGAVLGGVTLGDRLGGFMMNHAQTAASYEMSNTPTEIFDLASPQELLTGEGLVIAREVASAANNVMRMMFRAEWVEYPA